MNAALDKAYKTARSIVGLPPELLDTVANHIYQASLPPEKPVRGVEGIEGPKLDDVVMNGVMAGNASIG